MSQAYGSFTLGNLFEYSNISGQLLIQCPRSTVQTSCNDIRLENWPYDVFTGPIIPNASIVELIATVSNNSDIRRVVVDYDGANGRSKEINLGVFALFQRPLLRVGTNKILVIIKDRYYNVLSESSFEISVTRGQSRICQFKHVTSNDDLDCESPYSSCQQYFLEQKYCR